MSKCCNIVATLLQSSACLNVATMLQHCFGKLTSVSLKSGNMEVEISFSYDDVLQAFTITEQERSCED